MLKRISNIFLLTAVTVSLVVGLLTAQGVKSERDFFHAHSSESYVFLRDGQRIRSFLRATERLRAIDEIRKRNEEEKRISFLAVGDIMAHLPVSISARTSEGTYDFAQHYRFVQPIIEGADLAFANLETVVADGKKASGYPRFNAPKELVRDLKKVGFDIIGTANNHMLDQSLKGYFDTIREIRMHDLIQVGGRLNPSEDNFKIIEKNGLKVGLCAYTYSYNGFESGLGAERNLLSHIDLDRIGGDFKKMQRFETDFNIIFMHWGIEYRTVPREKDRELAQSIADIGFDLIVGSHPHVIQSYDVIRSNNRDVPVIYSLGNFISNQRRENMGVKRSEDGAIMLCDFVKKGGERSIRNIKFVPTWVEKSLSGSAPRFTIFPTRAFLERRIETEFTRDRIEKIRESERSTSEILGEVVIE